jgi:hypothetical protein
MVLELHALERIIEASGRQFLFIVAPNKSTVYPEHVGFVPNAAGCNRSRYDLLLENIDEYPLRSFVRLDEQLRNAKELYAHLYDKTSTYWNGLGAMVGAETIHQWISDGAMKQPRGDYHSSGSISNGDLYSQLMGFPALAEDRPFQSFLNPEHSDLPHGLLYSDDFIDNLLPHLAGMFSQLDVVPTHRVPSRQYRERLRDYDFILFERAESELATVHIDLDEIFSLFEHEVKIPERYHLDLSVAVPVSHISLDLRADGLQIKSMGPQSAFEITSVPGSDENIFRVLKLSIAASQSNIMTLMSLTGIPHVTQKSLKLGITEVYLPLKFEKALSLRIKPGNRAGLFVLRSAEILGFIRNPSALALLTDKNTVAKTDQGDEVTYLPEGSEESISESKEDDDILAAMSDRTVSGCTPEMELSGDNMVSSSREPSLEMTDDNTERIVIPEDLEGGVSLSEAEIGDSITVAERANGDEGSGDVTSIGAEASSSQEPEYKAADQVDEHALISKEADEAGSISQAEIGDSITVAESEKVSATSEDIASGDIMVPSPEEPSITLADFEDGRIFQRRGRSRNIMVSGTYTGMPKAIEARVVSDGTLEEIVPWTAIDTSPKNGIFLGELLHVPQGGWYNIQVRYRNNHGVSSRGTHKWGVGILVGCLGQSNMKGKPAAA